MLKDVLAYNKLCKDKGIIFSFCGTVSHQIVIGIGSTLQQKLKSDFESSSISTKVFSTFIEQIQNIMHYSAEQTYSIEEKSILSFGMIVLGKRNDKYFILCSS